MLRGRCGHWVLIQSYVSLNPKPIFSSWTNLNGYFIVLLFNSGQNLDVLVQSICIYILYYEYTLVTLKRKVINSLTHSPSPSPRGSSPLSHLFCCNTGTMPTWAMNVLVTVITSLIELRHRKICRSCSCLALTTSWLLLWHITSCQAMPPTVVVLCSSLLHLPGGRKLEFGVFLLHFHFLISVVWKHNYQSVCTIIYEIITGYQMLEVLYLGPLLKTDQTASTEEECQMQLSVKKLVS